MNQLIPIDTTGKKMSTREISELMDKRHADVMRDIKKLVDQEAITERNFALSEYKDSTGRKLPEYLLDFDATMILITGYDAKRRSIVIKRWRELETGEATPAYRIPQTYGDALRLAADLSDKNLKLVKKIEHDKPKVAFAEAISASNKSIPVKHFAQVISKDGRFVIGGINFSRWLKHERILTSDKPPRPYQRYIDSGWFEVIQKDNNRGHGPVIYHQSLITGPGQVAIYKLFCNSKSRNQFLNKAAKTNKLFLGQKLAAES